MHVLIEASKQIMPQEVSTILYFFVIVLFVFILFDKNLLISVSTSVCSFFIAFAMQGIVTSVFGFFIPLEYIFQHGIIIMTIVVLSAVLLHMHVPLHSATRIIEARKDIVILLTANFIIFLYFMFYLRFTTGDVRYLQDFGVFLITIMLALVSVYTVKVVSNATKKRTASSYYNEIERKISDQIIERSDIEKDLQMVYSLAIMEEFDKSKYHIRKYLYSFNGNEDLMELRRLALAMYLYVKMNILKDEGIDCHLEIDNPFVNHKITDYNLLQAVDILVTNAVEALKDGDNEIYINVTTEEDGRVISPLIEVLNRHEEIGFDEENGFYEKGFTTKPGKKGLGLYKLNKLSKDNNFQIIFENREIDDENYVCYGIWLRKLEK